MRNLKEIQFESPLAKQLYLEVSGMQENMRKIDRKYISTQYIWTVWQKVYKEHCGCTSYTVHYNNGEIK